MRVDLVEAKTLPFTKLVLDSCALRFIVISSSSRGYEATLPRLSLKTEADEVPLVRQWLVVNSCTT